MYNGLKVNKRKIEEKYTFLLSLLNPAGNLEALHFRPPRGAFCACCQIITQAHILLVPILLLSAANLSAGDREG